MDNESEDSKGDGKKSAKKSKNTTEWVEVTKNGPIQGKEYVPELKQYRYWVDIELEEGSVLEGSDVEIQASKYGKVYDMVVPRSCVIESRGQASVFVVKQREGVLGIENYVEQREVEILEKDDFNCAIEASIEDNEEIVVNASKPLADGMQVR